MQGGLETLCRTLQSEHFPFLFLFPSSVFCLELAPVPERAPARHTTTGRGRRCETQRQQGWGRHREEEKDKTRRGSRSQPAGLRCPCDAPSKTAIHGGHPHHKQVQSEMAPFHSKWNSRGGPISWRNTTYTIVRETNQHYKKPVNGGKK